MDDAALRREVHDALAAWRAASNAEMPRDSLVGWLQAIQAAERRFYAAIEARRAARGGRHG